jgi:hypothetical protein
MLSTKHSDNKISIGTKNKKQEVVKPEVVFLYISQKQGIDISNQISSYRSCLWKSLHWYHKVAIELIMGTAIVNAHILFNDRQAEEGKPKMKITQFREILCKSIMCAQSTSTPCKYVSTPRVHYSTESENRQQGKRNDRRLRRYCIGCYQSLSKLVGRNVAKRKARRVTTICSALESKPHFCFTCFPKFHAS